MEREGEASAKLGDVILSGHPAYHPSGYLYCPGEGVFELSAVRRRDSLDSWRWVFSCARQHDLSALPLDGWVEMPTWVEEMRQVES